MSNAKTLGVAAANLAVVSASVAFGGPLTSVLQNLLLNLGASCLFDLARNDIPNFVRTLGDTVRVNHHLSAAFVRATRLALLTESRKSNVCSAYAAACPREWSEINHRPVILALEELDERLIRAGKGSAEDLNELFVQLSESNLLATLDQGSSSAAHTLAQYFTEQNAGLPVQLTRWMAQQITLYAPVLFWEELKRDDTEGIAAWRAYSRCVFQQTTSKLTALEIATAGLSRQLDALQRGDDLWPRAQFEKALSSALEKAMAAMADENRIALLDITQWITHTTDQLAVLIRSGNAELSQSYDQKTTKLVQENEKLRAEVENLRIELIEQLKTHTALSTQILNEQREMKRVLTSESARVALQGAQAQAAKSHDISVTQLRKQLQEDQSAVQSILATIQAERQNLQTKQAEWQELHLEALVKAGDIAQAAGSYQQAQDSYAEALALLLPDSPGNQWYLVSISLAEVQCNRGNYEESRSTLTTALDQSAHSATLPAALKLAMELNLAITDSMDFKLEEAEAKFGSILKRQSDEIGEHHHDTGLTRANLADLLRRRGDFVGAQKLLDQFQWKNESEHVSPPTDESIRLTLTQAELIAQTGNLPRARALLERLVALQQQYPDQTYPSLLHVRRALADVIGDLGHREESYRAISELVPAFESRLGKEHPQTLSIKHRLGISHEYMGRLAQAKATYEDVYAQSLETFGGAHLMTASIASSLGIVEKKLKNYERAEKLQMSALEIRQSKLGPQHPETLSCIENLGNIYLETKRYKQAEKRFNASLSGRIAKLGMNHFETARSFHNFAVLRNQQGRRKEARRLAEKSFEAALPSLGPHHPEVQKYLFFLSSI